MVTSKRVSAIGQIALIFISAFVLLLLVEGFSSVIISSHQLISEPAASPEARFDENLGWVGNPNVYAPDLYGEGVYVRTNAQGFRNDEDTKPLVPPNKLRIICTGDSFTFGQGVANDETWCYRISALNSVFETVNMGLPGYGVDQAYLWYKRDGTVLERSIHIFAFIGGDLQRMGNSIFYGRDKPVLQVHDGELVVGNVPASLIRSKLRKSIIAADFRFIDLGTRIIGRLRDSGPQLSLPTLHVVATEVFREIQAINDEHGALTVFVYLPTDYDSAHDTEWRNLTHAIMDELDLILIDLTPALRSLPVDHIGSFFLPESNPVSGHYTKTGNDWVADEVLEKMMRVPEIRSLVDSISAND